MAVLDALGFKGIWEKYQPAAVLQRLQEVTNGAALAKEIWDKEFSKLPSGVIRLESRLAQFSDSLIVCAIGMKGPEYDAKCEALPFEAMALGYTLYYVSVTVSQILAVASYAKPLPEGPPPIIYRGAIACGSVWFGGNNHFVGPAIDEAAAAEGNSDGAFVVFCKSAIAATQRAAGALPLPVIRDYDVPSRKAGSQASHVVDPFGLIPAMARVFRPERVNDYALHAIAQLYESMRGFMDTKCGGSKWRNTRAFLNVAGTRVVRDLLPGEAPASGLLNMDTFVRDLRVAIEAARNAEIQ